MQNTECTIRKGNANLKVPTFLLRLRCRERSLHFTAKCPETKAAVLGIKAMVLHYKELRAALASDNPFAVSDWSADLSLPLAQ